jgi:hypothetical protein
VRERVTTLQQAHWPTAVQRLIGPVVDHFHRTMAFLATIGQVPADGRRAWVAHLEQLSTPADPAVTALRARLGLPTVDTVPARIGIRIQQRAERAGATGS